MSEEGPAGVDCDGDVALLVVTCGEGGHSVSLTRGQWPKASEASRGTASPRELCLPAFRVLGHTQEPDNQ